MHSSSIQNKSNCDYGAQLDHEAISATDTARSDWGGGGEAGWGGGWRGWRYRRRDVLGAQLSLHVGVIQLADEGVGPRLAGVDGDVHVVLPMPLSPLHITAEASLFSRTSSLLPTMMRAHFGAP